MILGNFKSKNKPSPIEHHDSAAWANNENPKKISNVNIPNEMQVNNAKDYVDDNQK